MEDTASQVGGGTWVVRALDVHEGVKGALAVAGSDAELVVLAGLSSRGMGRKWQQCGQMLLSLHKQALVSKPRLQLCCASAPVNVLP